MVNHARQLRDFKRSIMSPTLQESPYEPPRATPEISQRPTVEISTTALGVLFATVLALTSAGNHFAIFWGVNDFQYWRLRHYLPASFFFESILFLLALALAPIAAWSFPEPISVRKLGLLAMLVCPALLVSLAFGLVRLLGLPDEKVLIAASVVLVVTQVTFTSICCYAMIGRWLMLSIFTFVSGVVGVTAGIFHIAINSLVT